jgi:type IV fimbrial biogenesis protein FimT
MHSARALGYAYPMFTSSRFTCSQGRPRNRGFTVIELLVSVAIMGVLTAIATPVYLGTVDRWRVTNALDQMSSAVDLTRNSAIQRSGSVSLAKIAGSNCGTTQSWSCGWQVFRDANSDGTFDAADELIADFAVPDGVTVMRSANGASMTANRWGQLNGNGTAGFTFSPKRTGVASPTTSTVCINSGGRVRIVEGSVTC